MTREFVSLLFAEMCLLIWPVAARAQSAIAGVVKDSSGAVLPGVTVEASSDVLIERKRTAVTDGAGAYEIIDLRPGTYLVTVALTGFQTYKREHLELPSDFTATVDATMTVGTLEESIVVSTASPMIDTRSNVKAQVLPRDVLDGVPNAHTIQSIGQLIPGVSLSTPDVAGSQQMQQTYFSVHGSGQIATTMTVDGMIINSLIGDGAVQTYLNDATAQEMVYRTGGGGAEQPTSGLQINVVPREGGNRFAGQLSLAFENWQSDNFGQELKDVGVTSVDKLGNYHDISASQGGPLLRNRLWFFLSGRLSHEDKPVANTTNSAAVTEPVLTNAAASAAALASCRAGAASGVCPQGISPETVNSANARLTLQMSPRNKLSAYYDRIHKDRAAAMNGNDDERITAVHWNSPNFSTMAVKWTSTASNRLLIQGGWSSNIERFNNLYQAGLEQPLYSALWYSLASRVLDGVYRSVTGPAEYGHYPDRYNWQASTSYVTGTHNVQVGFQDSFGTDNQRYYANGDIQTNWTTTNGVVTPSSVLVMATSPWFEDRLNALVGVYVQDSWTIKRATLNYGLRWDYLLEAVVGQPANQGTFAVIPAYGDKNMPTQTNWDPNASIVFDLFGNGKTAVRAGYKRNAFAATTSLASSQDPGGNPMLTALWTDVNGDGIAQYQVTHNAAGQLVQTCVYKTPGCEVNFAAAPGVAGYGSTTLNEQDPNLKRSYQDKFNLGVSHELLRGVSVSLEWFHSNYGNLQQTFNLTRLQPCGGLTPPAVGGVGLPASDAVNLIACNQGLGTAAIAANPQYQLINVFSPLDGHVVPVYDLASSTISAIGANNFVTTDPKQTLVYNGFDVGFNARLPRGGRMFGGTTTERSLGNICDTAVTSPSNLLYCDQSHLGSGLTIPWRTQIKLSATSPLPWWGLIVNGSYQGLPGYVEGATTYSIRQGSTKYTTCPGTSAGAGCVPNALVAPTAVSSLSATLDPPGTTLTLRTNEVDIGLAKRMKVGRVRIDPKIDLFNALNSNDYYTVTSTVFAPILNPNLPPATAVTSPALPANAPGTNFPGYHQPSRFLQGRILRLGANFTW